MLVSAAEYTTMFNSAQSIYWGDHDDGFPASPDYSHLVSTVDEKIQCPHCLFHGGRHHPECIQRTCRVFDERNFASLLSDYDNSVLVGMHISMGEQP